MAAKIGRGNGLEQVAGLKERRITIKEDDKIPICRSSKKGKERVEAKDNLVFDDRHLSKLHANLVRKNGVLYVRDENSTFGTLLNGQYLRQNEFYKVLPLDVIGLIISKPSKEIRRVVDENSGLAMIPLKNFGTPKVALKLSYRVEGDCYIFSVASSKNCPFEGSRNLGLTLYRPPEQAWDDEDESRSNNQLEDSLEKLALLESEQVEFVVDTSQCQSKSANGEDDGDYPSDFKNLSYKGYQPDLNLRTDFGWESGYLFDSEDSIEPDEDYTSSQMDSSEARSLYLANSVGSASTTSFDGSTKSSSKEISDSEEDAFEGGNCCSIDHWLNNAEALKGSNSRKRKFSDYANDLLSEEDEFYVAGDRTNKKMKYDSAGGFATSFAKELAKGTFYVLATLTAIGVYGGYLEKYST